MPDGWSRSLDAGQLADRRTDIDFSIPLAQLARLAPMVWPVASRARIAIVADADAAERVAPEFETVLAPGGRITVGELVEEELLLALPIVPMHADRADCGVSAAGERAAEETQKPFAGLAALLKGGAGPDEE